MRTRDLYDPAEARKEAASIVDVANPVLLESLEYGRDVFTRCWNQAERDERSLFPFYPLHRLLEMMDAVRELVAQACSEACRPLLRTMFDAWLAVAYMTCDDRKRRAAAYAVADLHRRIAFLEGLDPSTERGKQAIAFMKKDEVAKHLAENPYFKDRSAQISYLQSFLESNELGEAAREWDRLRDLYGRAPRWHGLFNGPRTRQQLAARVGKAYLYEFLYREWSGTSHAEDMHRVTAIAGSPQFPLRRIRDCGGLASVTQIALSISSGCYRDVLRAYREDEADTNFVRWYVDTISPAYGRLAEREVQRLRGETG